MRLFPLLVPPIEILIIASGVYFLLSFFWNTRAMDLLLGLLACFFIYLGATFFHLPVIHRLTLYFVNVAMIGFLIIFQPECRLILTKLSFKGRKFRDITEFDKFLEGISQSVYRLSERRTGALILLEVQDSLEEFANRAVRLNAQFSPELLETLFNPSSPLHDGGVIIRGTSIVSAATILPLSDDYHQVTQSMGTRHRAGLGASQVTDALVIMISEETGNVSLARDGQIKRDLRIDRFRGIVRSIFTTPEAKLTRRIPFIHRLKAWNT